MRLYTLDGKCNISGERIKSARAKAKLTQDQLAARLQVAGLQMGQMAISRIESGKRLVPDFELPIIAEDMSLSLDNDAHMETVVLLSRETNPLTVEVRMEVETGEVKEHPTYKRIQEYVQEKYGFKVHTAYIAEVKRMVGLNMHKAPNAVEQRKHEYHPCPPEKVEAIKDALRHFGLISE